MKIKLLYVYSNFSWTECKLYIYIYIFFFFRFDCIAVEVLAAFVCHACLIVQPVHQPTPKVSQLILLLPTLPESPKVLTCLVC